MIRSLPGRQINFWKYPSRQFLAFAGECLWDSLRDCIAFLVEATCMVVNSLCRYPMMFTPDFDFQVVGLIILNQIEPLALYVWYVSEPWKFTSFYLFGVSVYREIEWSNIQHVLNAKTRKWGDASPVKEIITQISGLVKMLDYSSLTLLPHDG